MKASNYILIFAIFAAFFWGKSCNKPPSPEITSDTISSDTIYSKDTISSGIYKPKPILTNNLKPPKPRIDTIIRIDTFTSTDTIFIVKDYNTIYTYSDTLFKKDLFRLVINDEIFQNKIHSRSWVYFDLKPTVINTTIIKNKAKLYVGGQINGFNDVSVSFGLIYLDKKKNAFTGLYDPEKKIYSLGYYKKLF